MAIKLILISLFLAFVFGANAREITNEANETLLTLHEQNTFSQRAIKDFLEESGRSIVIKSLLLAPLGLLLLIFAGLSLVPLPVITTGRANRAIDLAKKVMSSEECVERIACEISSLTKRHESTSWIPNGIESYMKDSGWASRLKAGFHTTQGTCNHFRCHPIKSLSKL